MGEVGRERKISGSSISARAAAEHDMLMRDGDAGGFEIYDIRTIR